jgi:pilus assembly protein FimV
VRHSDKKHSIRLLTALLSALPLTAGAAGLGKLTVQSAIGQTLRAEVELSATAEELASMTARLAPPSAFKQAGVDFASSLSGVRVAVDKRGARPVLVVTSDRAVNEPFLDVLIELNWASGRLVREYTFLLDPADMPRPAPVEPSVVKDVAPRAAPVARVPAPSVPVDGAYEIRRGDTLNRIANQYKPADVSLDQMLVALVRANPDAFDNGNMNRMRAGRILTIPDQAAAESIAPQEARKIVSAQTTDFAATVRVLRVPLQTYRPPAMREAVQQAAASSRRLRIVRPLLQRHPIRFGCRNRRRETMVVSLRSRRK